MGITASIDISAEQRQILLDLLSKYLANTKVWAFGSRVKWTTRSNSDLDLVVFSSPEQDSQVSALKEALEESNLPFRVDLLVWDKLPENFQRNIEESYVVWVKGDDVGRDGVMSFSKLSEVSEIVDSLHKTPVYSDEGTPMVRCTDVKYGRLKLENVFHVSNNVFEEFSRRYKPNKDDIIITRVGSYGITALVDGTNFCLGQNVSAIMPKINPRYLYAVLNSPQLKNQIEFSVVGSTQKTLSLKAIGNLEIPRFDDEVENNIGKIIGDLDEKIELNHQLNKTLEQIAQALFKNWFVDFEPVKAKIAAKQAGANAEQIEQAALCAISGKSPEQLAQLNPQILQQLKTTAALFPDALVNSELGEIPEGWVVKLSGDVMDVRDGTHDSPKQSETGFPLITSKHITSGVLEINDAYLISENDYQKINKRSQVSQGDILLTMIGTVGLSYLVMQPIVNFAIKNVGLFRTSEVKELKNYFSLLLKSPAMQVYLNARMVGTTQKYLSLKTLRSIEMIVPSFELLGAFNNQVNPIMTKAFELLQENESLNQVKDTLLPKLLDGSIALDEFVGC